MPQVEMILSCSRASNSSRYVPPGDLKWTFSGVRSGMMSGLEYDSFFRSLWAFPACCSRRFGNGRFLCAVFFSGARSPLRCNHPASLLSLILPQAISSVYHPLSNGSPLICLCQFLQKCCESRNKVISKNGTVKDNSLLRKSESSYFNLSKKIRVFSPLFLPVFDKNPEFCQK